MAEVMDAPAGAEKTADGEVGVGGEGVSPGIVGAVVEAGEKLSPKAKASLGIPEDQRVAWVPVGLAKEDSEALAKVARARGTKVADMIVEQLKAGGGFDAFLSTVRTEAGALPARAKAAPREPKAPQTVEQLNASLTKAEAALERIKERVAAAQAAKTPPAQ